MDKALALEFLRTLKVGPSRAEMDRHLITTYGSLEICLANETIQAMFRELPYGWGLRIRRRAADAPWPRKGSEAAKRREQRFPRGSRFAKWMKHSVQGI
jgi:hypothetical protein